MDARARRAAALLWWVGAVMWLGATLHWFSLLDEAESLLSTILGYHVTHGFVSVSLGDVLALIVTIWAAFLVSRFVRFALEEDLYPRLPMGRGLPYAISSLLHYLILLLGFTVAIGAFGLDLNRLTVLTGAFGVGVGFGLQTIVNNFVSGVILLVGEFRAESRAACPRGPRRTRALQPSLRHWSVHDRRRD